jgi:membrane protease YdiL (CAAX protease family)
VAVLERDSSIGRAYDLVGPEKFTLAELVGRVSAALELRTWTIALPVSLMQLAAAAGEMALPHPPVTRSQLAMLVTGMHGDPEPARAELGLQPRRMSRERLRDLAGGVAVRWPSVRLVPDRRRAQSLAALTEAAPTLRWYVPVCLALLLASPRLLDPLWARMALVNGVLWATGAFAIRIDQRRLWRPTAGMVLTGLGLGLVMFAVARVGIATLDAIAPEFLAPSSRFVDAATDLTPALGIAALLGIVAAEDAVWRGAITLPLAAHFGAWRGAALAGLLFALGHATTGPPVLLVAAALAGFAWSAIAIRTRSLVATFVCHATWDLLVVSTGVP